MCVTAPKETAGWPALPIETGVPKTQLLWLFWDRQSCPVSPHRVWAPIANLCSSFSSLAKRSFPKSKPYFPLCSVAPQLSSLNHGEGINGYKDRLGSNQDSRWKANGSQTLTLLVLADMEALFQVCLKW